MKFFQPTILLLTLVGRGAGFEYESGDCLRLSDPDTLILDKAGNLVAPNHFAKVEGFGTPNNSTSADSYALSFDKVPTQTIFWRPDYIEGNSSKIIASSCMEP